NSLALLSDAGHVLTDAFALSISLIAVLIMRKRSDYRATYGYHRIGILAAIINGISLVIIAIFIFFEAYKRFTEPLFINSTVMITIAIVGLVGNLLMTFLLKGHHEDLNIKSAWLHVLGDTLSSIGVIIAAIIIYLTGWTLIDPIAGILIGMIIIAGGIRVVKESLWIFLEFTPLGFHPEEIIALICRIPGVVGVHDVHIWSIGHGMPAFSAHVKVIDQKLSEADRIRNQIEKRVSELGIRHSVIQIECAGCEDGEIYCDVKGLQDKELHSKS
ncbi:MAG: cation diffusion facilitator family transporter, partial [Thermodesulfovibrionales bacterium]